MFYLVESDKIPEAEGLNIIQAFDKKNDTIDDLLLQEIVSLKEKLKIVIRQIKKEKGDTINGFMHDIGTEDYQSFFEDDTGDNY